VTAFVERSLRYQSLADAEPQAGEWCFVRICGDLHTAEYTVGAFAAWVLPGGRRFRAVPSDEWRPEDDR